MPVDASPYTSATAAPAPDPLAQIGKVLQIQQAGVALQGAQQELRARQALGPILQQSINPETGELDINKFLVHGAANPDVAWKMPEITLQMIQRQNTQADTVIKQLEANKVRYGAMGDLAGSLVGMAQESAKSRIGTNGAPGAPGITIKQLAGALSNPAVIGENGLLDPKDAAEFLSKTATMTDQQRYAFIKQTADMARGVDKTMTDIYGHVVAHGAGGATVLRRESPFTGASVPASGAGPIAHTPEPGSQNELVEVTKPNGSVVKVPRWQAAQMSQGAAPGSAPAVIPGTGQGGQVVPGTISPMEKQLQEGRAKEAVEFERGLTEANTVGQENIRILREMQTAMKDFRTGGGMAVRQQLASMAQGLGAPQKLVDELAGGNKGALDEFRKLAIRYATSEMKTNMGTSQRFTNLDFNTFLKNNPTIDTDPRGLEKMFKFLEQGVNRAGHQLDAYNAWKNGERPKGFEQSDISAFPAFWTKVLERANRPSEANQ